MHEDKLACSEFNSTSVRLVPTIFGSVCQQEKQSRPFSRLISSSIKRFMQMYLYISRSEGLPVMYYIWTVCLWQMTQLSAK